VIVQQKFTKKIKDAKFNNSWIDMVTKPHLMNVEHSNRSFYRATLLETINGNGTSLLISSGDRTMIGRYVSTNDTAGAACHKPLSYEPDLAVFKKVEVHDGLAVAIDQ
jgi:hypothetical protein